MELLRALITGMVRYSLYAFIIFSLVVSLLSGIADLTYYSRRTAAQDEWIREADAEGEEFIEVDYTPNMLTGVAAFVMFAVSSVLAVFFLRKKFRAGTHVLLIAVTGFAAFIFFLPRPPLGTGTEGMKEVFAYLMVLGIIDSALYRTYFMADNPTEDQTVLGQNG